MSEKSVSKQSFTNPFEAPARAVVLDYGVKAPPEEYPDEYRTHPLFGDPSYEFDVAWEKRLIRTVVHLVTDLFLLSHQ